MTHTQIALRLVVIERHGELMYETQHRLATALKPIEQIPGRRLFRSFPTRRGKRFRIALQAFPDQGTVLEMEVRELHHIELGVARLSSVRHGLFHLQQQVCASAWPRAA